MPVNKEFQAQSAAIFAQHGFVRRKRGQRGMGYLLPDLLFASDYGAPGKPYGAQLLGHAPGYGPGGQVVQLQLLKVQVPGGQWVPAYSRGGTYAVCQELNYVPA